jgi:hypothetical protein
MIMVLERLKSGQKIQAVVPADVGLGDAPGEFVRVKSE